MLGILFTFVISEELPYGFQELLTNVVVQYLVKLDDGTIVKRHVDHVKTSQLTDDIAKLEDDFYSINDNSGAIPVSIDKSPNTAELRRSNRQRRPPQHYCDYNST